MLLNSVTTPVVINPSLAGSIAKVPSVIASTEPNSALSYIQPTIIARPPAIAQTVAVHPPVFSTPVVETRLPISKIHRIETNPDYSQLPPPRQVEYIERPLPSRVHREFPHYRPLMVQEPKKKGCCDYWVLFLLLGLLALALALFFGIRALTANNNNNRPNQTTPTGPITPVMTPRNVPSVPPPKQPINQPPPALRPPNSPTQSNPPTQPNPPNQVDPVSVQPITNPPTPPPTNQAPKVAVAPSQANPVPVSSVPNTMAPVTPESQNPRPLQPEFPNRDFRPQQVEIPPISSLPVPGPQRHVLRVVRASAE